MTLHDRILYDENNSPRGMSVKKLTKSYSLWYLILEKCVFLFNVGVESR